MEIKIGQRTIPLALTTYELIAIQQEIGCTAAQLRDVVFGITEEEPGKDGQPKYRFSVATDGERMARMGTLIRILGNAGLEEAGEKPDLTEKWILRNLKPALVLPMAIVLISVINDAMMMENTEESNAESSEPVDVTIEEENRKKAPRK